MTGEARVPVACRNCGKVVRHLTDEEWNEYDFDFTDYTIRQDGVFEIEECDLCQRNQ